MSVRASQRQTVPVPTELTPAALAQFEARMQDAVRSGARAVSLDCRELRHVTSKYVNVFWLAYERCTEEGIAVQLQEPSRGLIRTLQIMDLAHFFGLSDPSTEPVPEGEPAHMANTAGVYTDRFRPDAASIDAAADRFVGFLTRTAGDGVMEFELRTVFYEVATNIRLHAKADPSTDATLTTTVADDKFILCFRYAGVEFDPTRRGAKLDFVAAARTGQKRGFGLAMVHRLTDQLSYVREDGGWNVLTLEKRRRPQV